MSPAAPFIRGVGGGLLLALFLAGRAAAGGGVSPVIPVDESGRKLRWNVKSWAAVSMIDPAGLNSLPATYLEWWQAEAWSNPTNLWFGATVGEPDAREISWALGQGLSAGYQATPILEIAVKLGTLNLQHGRTNTEVTGQPAAGTMLDSWAWGGEMLLASAGGGFKLTFTERTRAVVSLLLGVGIADVSISHLRIWKQSGGVSTLAGSSADVRGTAFVPEFSVEVEHDLAPRVAVGASLGYRFGEIDTFKYARPANIFFLTSEYASGGDILRHPGGLLTADLGGPVLAVNLTFRL